MSEHGTKDALGNEIIIGNLYGYSVDRNGFTRTTVGKVRKFNAGGTASLESILSRRSLWMDEAEFKTTAKVVAVKPAKLFPVDEKYLK